MTAMYAYVSKSAGVAAIGSDDLETARGGRADKIEPLQGGRFAVGITGVNLPQNVVGYMQSREIWGNGQKFDSASELLSLLFQETRYYADARRKADERHAELSEDNAQIWTETQLQGTTVVALDLEQREIWEADFGQLYQPVGPNLPLLEQHPPDKLILFAIPRQMRSTKVQDLPNTNTDPRALFGAELASDQLQAKGTDFEGTFGAMGATAWLDDSGTHWQSCFKTIRESIDSSVARW
jgi:hypothetical protein